LTFVNSETRLWKRLTPGERAQAATHFFEDPTAESAASAIMAIAQARRMRPQAARALPAEQRARALAQILDPGEVVAGALIVALHLGARRPLLAAFLDLLKLPHEGGLLKDEAADRPPPTSEEAEKAVVELAGRFPPHEVETYLNALWLQDPEHWAVLEQGVEWISRASSPDPAP
jgi:hypothetical protein